ncbi:uncharacterized protein ACO6RY_03156 [Pungitius sinensis]
MEVTNRTTAMPDTVNTPCPWETATVALSVVLTVLVVTNRRPRRPEASPESPDEGLPLSSPVNRGTIAG